MPQPKRRPLEILLSLFLAAVGAQGVHWLLTPAAHPDASDFRTAAVVAQTIIGFGAAAIVFVRSQRSSRRA